MGFFGSKKKGNESLKTLSEKEIQSRLYGHLRTQDRIIQEDLPSLSKPKLESHQYHKSAEASNKTVTPSTAHSVKITSPDLFKTPDAKPAAEEKHGHQASIASKVYTQKPVPTAAPQSDRFTKLAKSTLSGAIRGLKTVGFKVVELITVVIAVVMKAVSSIDFRKSNVRRFFYALAAGALLSFIFIGIHHLNKNREVAMKAPHKNPPVHVTKKSKSKNHAEPLQAALNAENAETENSETAENNASESTEAKTVKKAATAKASVESAAKTPAKTIAAEDKKLKSSVVAAPKSEPKTPSAEDAEVTEGPAYVIQVATFATREDAGKLVDKFKTAGFHSFFKSVSRSGGRVYYCVFIGKFKNHTEADNILADFKKTEVAKPFQDAFVRSA